MKIIGVAGTNGSGKDTVANLLVKKYGYYFASATQILGDELTRRGLSHERENKRLVSAEWRRQYGLGVIVDKGLEEAKAAGYDKLVVGSLRHPGEVDRVHELGGEVIWIDADPRIRYERITSTDRGRVEDQKTFEQFLSEQEVEMTSSGDAATLNMAGVKAKADRFLENNSTDIKAFRKQMEAALADLI